MCGPPGAPLEERPFDATFTEKNILRASDDVALTSSSLMENSKLRRTVSKGTLKRPRTRHGLPLSRP